MNKTVSLIIKLVLLGIAGVLGYFIVAGIKKPIDFEAEKDKRFEKTIARLKDIRTAQVAYKEWYGTYTPSFDTLINFIKHGNIKVIFSVGNVPDSLTESEALKKGIITRDTILVPVLDSLFKNIKYNIDSLPYIPCGNRAKFGMDTASVLTGSGVEVKVFEARVSYWNILDGLNKQLIINFNSAKRTRSSVDVYVNHNRVLSSASLQNGKGPKNLKFEANKGDTIFVSYIAGAWSHENYINIIDPNNKFILKEHSPNPLNIWNSKSLENSGEYTIQLFDKFGDGWYGAMSVGSLIEVNNNAGNWE